MFSAIKSIIAVGMLVGVVFLAYEIFLKTSEFQTELNKKKAEIEQKIEELKKVAVEKKEAMDKAINNVTKSPLETTADQVVSQGSEDQKEKLGTANEPAAATEPMVRLNPMDEEDRELTAKILDKPSNSKPTQPVAKQPTIESKEPLIGAAIVPESKPAEPLDFERMSKIREMYSSTVEILDWE